MDRKLAHVTGWVSVESGHSSAHVAGAGHAGVFSVGSATHREPPRGFIRRITYLGKMVLQ